MSKPDREQNRHKRADSVAQIKEDRDTIEEGVDTLSDDAAAIVSALLVLADVTRALQDSVDDLGAILEDR